MEGEERKERKGGRGKEGGRSRSRPILPSPLDRMIPSEAHGQAAAPAEAEGAVVAVPAVILRKDLCYHHQYEAPDLAREAAGRRPAAVFPRRGSQRLQSRALVRAHLRCTLPFLPLILSFPFPPYSLDPSFRTCPPCPNTFISTNLRRGREDRGRREGARESEGSKDEGREGEREGREQER